MIILAVKDKDRVYMGVSVNPASFPSEEILDNNSSVFRVKQSKDSLIGFAGSYKNMEITRCQDDLIRDKEIGEEGLTSYYVTARMFPRIVDYYLRYHVFDADEVRQDYDCPMIIAKANRLFVFDGAGNTREVDNYAAMGTIWMTGEQLLKELYGDPDPIYVLLKAFDLARLTGDIKYPFIIRNTITDEKLIFNERKAQSYILRHEGKEER